MGSLINIIATVLVGALAGWIAGQIMKKNGGMLYYIVIGIVGSFLGTFVFGLLGFSAHGLIASIATSVIGACLLIFIIDKFFRK